MYDGDYMEIHNGNTLKLSLDVISRIKRAALETSCPVGQVEIFEAIAENVLVQALYALIERENGSLEIPIPATVPTHNRNPKLVFDYDQGLDKLMVSIETQEEQHHGH